MLTQKFKIKNSLNSMNEKKCWILSEREGFKLLKILFENSFLVCQNFLNKQKILKSKKSAKKWLKISFKIINQKISH